MTLIKRLLLRLLEPYRPPPPKMVSHGWTPLEFFRSFIAVIALVLVIAGAGSLLPKPITSALLVAILLLLYFI